MLTSRIHKMKRKEGFWAYKDDAVKSWKRDRHKFFLSKKRFFEDWLDRLVVMGVIEQEDWHRENGKLFNIPKCCREWFIELTNLDIHPSITMNSFFGESDYKKYPYVRCTCCRIKEILNETS